MLNNYQGVETIILNTPKELKLNKLFPTYSLTKLDKVIFIIHQCNYYSSTGYNLDLENHRIFFGLSKNQLREIIKGLVQANIIKLYSGAIARTKSAYYTIVSRFDLTDEQSINKHFYNLNGKCPLFIQKWVADDYSVRNKKTTKFIKSKKMDNKDLEIQLLKERIKNLELMLSLTTINQSGNSIPVAEMQLVTSEGNTGGIEPEEDSSGELKTYDGTSISIKQIGEGLIIRDNDSFGFIDNYNLMVGWFDRLSTDRQITLLKLLLNSKSTKESFEVVKNTRATFYRDIEDGDLIITYNTLVDL